VGHVWEHPSAARDAKADADARCQDWPARSAGCTSCSSRGPAGPPGRRSAPPVRARLPDGAPRPPTPRRRPARPARR